MSEYTRTIRDDYGTAYTVHVDKIGGGTVGKRYAREEWDVKVVNSDGVTVFDSEGELYIGANADHEDAACIAFDWYVASEDV